MNQQPSIKKRRLGTAGFWILVAVGAVIAVCVLAILIDSAVYYNKVHAGISVSGVDLGGQSKEEAMASINAVVDQAKGNPITLTAPGKSWTLMPDDVGTTMDVEGAVNAALAVTRENGFFTDIGTRWKRYFNKQELPLNGGVDGARMAAFVAGVAKQLDLEPINASLAIKNGQIEVIESVDGRAVDQARLSEQLASLLVTLHSTTVEVPIGVKEPAVTAEDNAAAQQQAETMISAPVTVSDRDKAWSVTPEEIVSYMGFRSENRNGVSTLVPYMDSTKLQPLLEQIAPDVAKKPKNASFASDGSRAWVVPGENGEELDIEATAQAITEATLKPSGRTVQVVVKADEPDLTTEEAKAMGIKDKLSAYTTKYTGGANRQVNVRITTQYATGVILAPGEEYNFDKQIGPRTTARGYKLAPGIVGPNELEDVLGGGICQVSTTMFNAVIEAGLKVTERWNHSIYISHYPKGRDATVTGGGKNLRFVNDTGKYIWVRGSSDGRTTTIAIYGTDDGRTSKITVGDFYAVTGMSTVKIADPTMKAGTQKVISEGQSGRSLKTHYVVTRNGKVLHDKIFVSRWPMYPTQVAVGTATTSTTSSTTTTTTEGTTTTTGG